MTTDYQVVAPFRPFSYETGHHKALADFDWIAAIEMLGDSVKRACGRDLTVLTDIDTILPLRCLHFTTTRRRLMLWYLEIAAVFLESAAFDRDTIALDSDQLIYKDLGRWFLPRADLGILVRKPPKNGPGYPILNGVQWWSYKAKDKLATFYREALAVAENLPEEEIVWGADTVALWRLLFPLAPGTIQERAGLRVNMIQAETVLETFAFDQQEALEQGLPMRQPYRAVLDFRNLRKAYMARAYAATLGVPA